VRAKPQAVIALHGQAGRMMSDENDRCEENKRVDQADGGK
jgi:hypothetical protein